MKHTIILVSLMLISVINYSQVKTNHPKSTIMEHTNNNKSIIRDLYEDILNNRKFDQLKNIISDDYVGPNGKRGADAFAEQVLALIKAFPDAHWTLHNIIAEGNTVAVTQELKGTHTGMFQHLAATGTTIANAGMGIYVLSNGKIISHQLQTDRLGFLQALGVLPSDLSTLTSERSSKEQVQFIDKFHVPAASKAEFFERMKANRAIISTLPGYIKTDVFEQPENDGSLSIITIARWQNKEAVTHAKDAVQVEFKRIGFDPQQFYQRLNITLERGLYQITDN